MINFTACSFLFYIRQKDIFRFPSLTLYVVFLCLSTSCEFLHDPSFTGEAPSSPGTKWEGEKISYPNPTDIPFQAEDLEGTQSIADLLNIALFNHPSTRASWHAARALAYSYRSSFSNYYPVIAYNGILTFENTTLRNSTVSSSTGNTGTLTTVDTGTSTTTTTSTTTDVTNNLTQVNTISNQLNLNYLVFDFGGREAQTNLALQTLYAADWQHNFTMQQVLINVLNAYTSYIGNKGLREANEENIKDAEIAVKSAEIMQLAGLATLTDVMQAKAALAQANLNLAQAKGAEKTALGNLVIGIGLPLSTLLKVEDLPNKLPLVEISHNIAGLFELAKKKRPDLGVAIAAIKQQEAQLGISLSASLPTVTLNGVLNRLHYIGHPLLDGHDNYLSADLNIPLFQGFYYVNQRRQLRAQIDQALANLDVQVSQVATQLVANYYAFTSAAAALPFSELNLDYSNRAFEGYVSQYKVGAASILDMLTSLTALNNARAQAIVTRTQWANALANLAFAVGILNDTHVVWQDQNSLSEIYSTKQD